MKWFCSLGDFFLKYHLAFLKTNMFFFLLGLFEQIQGLLSGFRGSERGLLGFLRWPEAKREPRAFRKLRRNGPLK